MKQSASFSFQSARKSSGCSLSARLQTTGKHFRRKACQLETSGNLPAKFARARRREASEVFSRGALKNSHFPHSRESGLPGSGRLHGQIYISARCYLVAQRGFYDAAAIRPLLKNTCCCNLLGKLDVRGLV